MYEYMIIDEHKGEVLGYVNTEAEGKARCEREAVKYGTHRLTVVRRVATLESIRTWK